MKQSEFVVRTSMELDDYKKFLFIDKFQREKVIIYAVISIFVSLIVNYINKTMNATSFIKYFAIFFLVFMLVRLLKIWSTYQGIKKMQRLNQLGYTNIFSFKEQDLTIQNSKIDGSTNIKYKDIGFVKETKDFILLYVTPKQCSAIRKKDVTDINAFIEFLTEKFAENFKKMK